MKAHVFQIDFKSKPNFIAKSLANSNLSISISFSCNRNKEFSLLERIYEINSFVLQFALINIRIASNLRNKKSIEFINSKLSSCRETFAEVSKDLIIPITNP